MLGFISGGREDAGMVSSWERRTSQESLSGKRGSLKKWKKMPGYTQERGMTPGSPQKV